MKFSIVFLSLLAAARADSLDAILARMDAAAKTFKSVTATFTQTEYTAVIKDLSQPETGDLKIKRAGGHVSALVAFTETNPHAMAVKGHTAWIFYPKAQYADEYDLSKYAGVIDQFLLLAFGTSGAELRKTYDVSLGGAETLHGIPTSRLELTPKTAELKKLISRIELWIPEGQSNAIQEKVTQPSGNYNLAVYTNIKLNPNLPDSAVELKLDGVKINHPQR